MAVRIHTLAKEIGMENKELLDLLKERGHDVKTVSSTIDNISADALRSEFSETSVSETTNESLPEPLADSSSSEDAKKESKLPGSFLPAAAVVKSAEQVEEERRKKDEAEGKSAPEPGHGLSGQSKLVLNLLQTDEVTTCKVHSPSSIEKTAFCSRCCPKDSFEASEEKPAPAGAAPNPWLYLLSPNPLKFRSPKWQRMVRKFSN